MEDLAEGLDSLVVELGDLGRESWMPLFVVLRDALTLDAALEQRIRERIRTALSARHVPNDIFQVQQVPRTLTGKKMELPVKKLFLGMPVEQVANRDAMANTESLGYYMALAQQRAAP